MIREIRHFPLLVIRLFGVFSLRLEAGNLLVIGKCEQVSRGRVRVSSFLHILIMPGRESFSPRWIVHRDWMGPQNLNKGIGHPVSGIYQHITI